MKTIKVKWDYVETAFERNSPDLQSYIDRETGDVLVIVEGLAEDDEARRKVASRPERYVRIEPASSREQYRWMERFVSSVPDDQLRERLLLSIDGKGAFRRFKDVLLSFPVERERWFNFRADLLHYHINEWFKSKELETEPVPPWGEVEPPPELDEPLARAAADGQGPADLLRKQLKTLVDLLPACELHTARVFLEFLRDKGTAELLGTRPKTDPQKSVYGSKTQADEVANGGSYRGLRDRAGSLL
jgi:hypothetical protein